MLGTTHDYLLYNITVKLLRKSSIRITLNEELRKSDFRTVLSLFLAGNFTGSGMSI